MAEEDNENQDRTEEATPERREEFRERGDIANSKEITSVFLLASITGFGLLYAGYFIESLLRYMSHVFENLSYQDFTEEFAARTIADMWITILKAITPFFAVTTIVALFITFFQTRLNWSWKKLQPNFGVLNPLKGLVRMVGPNALMELFKGIAKMLAVGLVSFLILRSEWMVVPGLLTYSLPRIWSYWADITQSLFIAVASLLVLVAGLDYLYAFISLERKMKMTKKEVKEEFKKREVDPQVKNKMKQMQREFSMAKTIQAMSDATVIVTNPEHFAVALKYELGMFAPVVIAKGKDFVAQKMKEVAREKDIPIVENKPLARTLFKLVEVGEIIPESLFRAVSEVIRYVFLLKGRSLSRN